MGLLNRIVYSLCLLNIIVALVAAPLQLFYVTLAMKWQDECSIFLLLTCIWCSIVFSLLAVLHFYILYNKRSGHWNGLRKNMRFLGVFSFVTFGQIIFILFVKYRLEHFTQRRFLHAVQHYFDPRDSSSQQYIDGVQTNGRCCGYWGYPDWDVTRPLPPSCCDAKDMPCRPRSAYQTGCKLFYHDIIEGGTRIPAYVNGGLLLSCLTVYIIIMTYLQFSGIVLYEEIPSGQRDNFEASASGTHQSWGTPRPSLSVNCNEEKGITPNAVVSSGTAIA